MTLGSYLWISISLWEVSQSSLSLLTLLFTRSLSLTLTQTTFKLDPMKKILAIVKEILMADPNVSPIQATFMHPKLKILYSDKLFTECHKIYCKIKKFININ